MLAPLSGTWTGARISGSLHYAGWGTAHGCPGARLADKDIRSITAAADPTSVVGRLLHWSADLADLWQPLNDLEGTGYQAEFTTALLLSEEFCLRVGSTVLTDIRQ